MVQYLGHLDQFHFGYQVLIAHFDVTGYRRRKLSHMPSLALRFTKAKIRQTRVFMKSRA